MKHLKLFESYNRYEKTLNEINNAKVGDILDESTIYTYVEYLNNKSNIHDYEESFIDGDLGDRIEEYSKYKLMNIQLSKIDLDDFYLDDDEMLHYVELYKKYKTYPPIVLDSKYDIIDGNHRANALKHIGKDKILAFVGID